MNVPFDVETFLATATYRYRLDNDDFQVNLAVKHLLATPGLGVTNAEITGIRWMTQMVSAKSPMRCLVGRAPSDKVAVVIYSDNHAAVVACEKEMPEEIILAMGDMLQCLAGGNPPWIRVARVILQAAFDIIHATAPKVDYDSAWRGGMDYLDGACACPTNEAKSFVDLRGRRGILLSCDTATQKGKGSVVIFERYEYDKDSPLVFNAPRDYTTLSTGLVDDVAHLHQRLLDAAGIAVVINAET